MRQLPWWRGQRGVSVAMLAVALVALLGMAALAVDLGMLQKTRAEAQRAADAAALAGASAYLLDLPAAAETLEAGRRARQVADTNSMAGFKIDAVTELTVWSIPDSQKVRVLVRRERVPTWFARIFGRDAFPVGARAAAVADYAGGVRCVRPIAVMDFYNEASSLEDLNSNRVPESNEIWDFDPPGDGDTYAKAERDGAGSGLGSDWRNTTGAPYVKDRGRPMVLRAQGNTKTDAVCSSTRGNKCLGPGWWGLWDPWADESQEQASNPNIAKGLTPTLTEENCADVKLDHAPGYAYKAGEVGSFAKDFEAVLKADPGAQWDEGCTMGLETGCVVGTNVTGGNANWRASPRVWIMGIMSPYVADSLAQAGNTAGSRVRFVDFALFFFEACANSQTGQKRANNECKSQDDLWGRFIGVAPGTGPGTSTLSRLIRLVE